MTASVPSSTASNRGRGVRYWVVLCYVSHDQYKCRAPTTSTNAQQLSDARRDRYECSMGPHKHRYTVLDDYKKRLTHHTHLHWPHPSSQLLWASDCRRAGQQRAALVRAKGEGHTTQAIRGKTTRSQPRSFNPKLSHAEKVIQTV